ncbi:MAG: DUF2752 domain-containing protein [Clostridia bacterium]|nr:DUF2752 domain-containing protein [Clostridia bacterium]
MRTRVWRICAIYAVVLLAGLSYLLLIRSTPFVGIPCFFHEMTGLCCPGCGLTRGIVALSRGDILLALGYNPLLPLYALYGGWFVGSVTAKYLKTGQLDPLPGPLWIHVGMILIVLLFWVLRNI